MSDKKRILVIGSGGREHTIVWKLKQSPRLEAVYCAPGNAGIAKDAQLVSVDFGKNFEGIIAWAKENKIDYTVVGPEVPLSEGITDAFEDAGLKVFGPRLEAARLESSKAFAKEVMVEAGIPTAASETFTDADAACAYAEELGLPVVIKADGLAAGKGVVIANTKEEADQAIRDNIENKQFGDASSTVVVEEFLRGEEASMLVLMDGNTFVPLASAQDHKALYENDLGPNTGGMGTYSPAPVVTDEVLREINEQVLNPLHEYLQKKHIPFRGVLFAGLMVTKNGIKVLEFNCRFGDPETQVVLPRMKNDFVDIVEAVCEGTLHKHNLEYTDDAAVCVVLASRGYPQTSEKNVVINGLDDVENGGKAVVFHAATALIDGKFVTAGGRVLGVTALGRDLPRAIDTVYKEVDKIQFDGAQLRRDIGKKALARL